VTKVTDDQDPGRFAERSTLLNVVVRVSKGTDLKSAAKAEGMELRDVLGKCLSEAGFGAALQVAQNERANRQGWDHRTLLQNIVDGVAETAMNVSDLQP
jgi:hypothetical protein